MLEALTPAHTTRSARGPAAERETLAIELTAREQAVLDLMSRGLGNKEIARALNLAEGTVKNHASAVLGKLGIADRMKAVLFAIANGLVRTGLDPKRWEAPPGPLRATRCANRANSIGTSASVKALQSRASGSTAHPGSHVEPPSGRPVRKQAGDGAGSNR